MTPVEQAEQIARSMAKKAGKDFDALTEAEKERLNLLALDEVLANKPSNDD